MAEKRVTIKDVAKEAGVSITTVSHALNGFSDVNPKTRERIWTISRRLNYTPNPAGRSLGGIPKKVLALIVLGAMLPEDPSAFIYGIMSGIYRVAMDHDYDFMLLTAPTAKQQEISFEQLCRAKELTGAVLFGMRTDDLYFEQAGASSIPCCSVDMDIRSENCRYISADNVKAAQEITEMMLKQGYQHPAMINGTRFAHVSRQRLKGYRLALENNGLPFRPELVAEGLFLEDAAQQEAERLLRQYPEIDGFVCASDNMAIGAYRAARKLKKRVPEELGISGFDDIAIARYYHGGLSTVAQHPYQVGLQAARIVLSLIEGREVPFWTKTDYEIMCRHSTDREHLLLPID